MSAPKHIPHDIAGAVRALNAHPAILSATLRGQDGSESYTPIDIDVRIEMYQSWMAAGQSPNGVRKTESIRLIFPNDYPLSAPIPLLREDFDTSLAHMMPGTFLDRPIPCIYEGSNDELLLQRGLLALVDQLVEWLTNAARGTLIDPTQGWEPVRRDSLNNSVIADSHELRSRAGDKGGYAAYPLECFRFRFEGKFSHYGQLGPTSVPISPENISEYYKYKSPIGDDQASMLRSIGLFVWPGKDASGKPIVADTYQPDTVTTLSQLYDRAAQYGCKQGLTDGIDWLTKCIASLKIREPMPLVIVLAARRPFHIIGSGSNIELIPYLTEISGPAPFPEEGRTQVYPAAFREAIKPALLRRLSGVSLDQDAPRIVMLGAGSLGSKLSLHLARAGLAPNHIVDRSQLAPHNAARHGLLPEEGAVGPRFYGEKATEVAKAIKDLGQIATSYVGNIVDLLQNPDLTAEHLHKKSWAVVNSTASLGVREALAALPRTDKVPRIIETTLFSQAQFGLVTVEGPNRNPDTGELITEAYEAIRSDESARRAIFEASSELKRVHVGDGCGSMTMIATDAQISLLAAPMAEMIRTMQMANLPATGTVSLAKVTCHGRGLQWTDHNVPNYTRLDTEDHSGWRVSISPRARDKILTEVENFRRVEAGGILWGRISEATRAFYIVDVMPAPTDSRRSASLFELGVKGLRRKLREYVNSTNGCLYCVGTWHSHLTDSGPSALDRDTARILAMGRITPSVLLIHTPARFRAIVAENVSRNDAFPQSSPTTEMAPT